MKEGWPCHQEKGPVPKWHGRGGRSQVMFRNAFLNMVCERPPRLLLRWLRSILLMAQPPLLRKEGSTFGEFIHSCFHEKPAVIDRRYSCARIPPHYEPQTTDRRNCRHHNHHCDCAGICFIF